MLNIEQHRQIMFLILTEISQSDIGSSIAFKGGTLAYFLFGLDRFSTDLDFDLLEDVSVEHVIVDIIKRYGIVKKKNRIILSYKKGVDNLKIDINRKIWKNNKYEIVNFFGNNIRIQTRETLFTNKLVALTERNTNRDIYDVWFFWKNNFDINDKLIYERTGLAREELLQKILLKLQGLGSHYKILDGLGEVLSENQKVYVSHKLIGDLVGMLEMSIEFLA